MSIFINPLALIQKGRRRLEPPVLPSPDMEQYDERYQPGVAGNMMFREGVNDAPVVSLGAMPSFPPRMAESEPQPSEDQGQYDPLLKMPRMGGLKAQPLAPPVLETPPVPARMGGAPIPEMMSEAQAPIALPPLNRTQQAIAASPKPELPDHSKDKKRGFWSSAGHRLEHIGKGALLGAARGGLGGMIYGGIAGGVEPELADQLEYNLSTQPQWLQQRKIALEEAGVLDDADRQTELSNLTQAQIANLDADNKRQATKDTYDLEQKRKEALAKTEKEAYERIKDSLSQRASLTKEGGEFVDSPSRLLFGSRGVDAQGKPLPITKNQGNIIPSLDNKGFFRQPSTQQEQDRKLEQIRAQGDIDAAKALKLKNLLRPGELDEFEEKEKIKRKYGNQEPDPIDLTGVPTIKEFENAKREAEELGRKADLIPDNADAESLGLKAKFRTESQSALGRAESLKAAMIESGGYEDNSGGGSPGVRRLQRTKKGGVAASAPAGKGTLSTESGGYKVEQKVRVKKTGKFHKILRFEDGQPVLDPNPIQ